MSKMTWRVLPPGISQETLSGLLEDARGRELLFRDVARRFEQRYTCSLEELERRLDQGQGNEHPDWEDSIEWRNAVESMRRAQIMRSLLEWLLPLIAPLAAS